MVALALPPSTITFFTSTSFPLHFHFPLPPPPISDAIWREIERGWEESDDSDIDDEDGDLYLEEWDDY